MGFLVMELATFTIPPKKNYHSLLLRKMALGYFINKGWPLTGQHTQTSDPNVVNLHTGFLHNRGNITYQDIQYLSPE